jgi:hypothetical protein
MKIKKKTSYGFVNIYLTTKKSKSVQVLPYPKDTPINKKKYFVKFRIWNRINYNHNLHFRNLHQNFSLKKNF